MRIPLGSLKRALPTTAVRDLWRMLSLCALVGVVAGLGAIVFFFLLDAARWFFLEFLIGYHPIPPGGEAPLFDPPVTEFRRWLFFLVPAAGGLIVGPIIYWLAPEAEGHGTDAAIDSYHNKGGKVRARVPIIKALVSAITIGSGGSGGREGPIAQIGSGFGSQLATWLKLRPHERRILMAAGMAAGVGAIFHAPLAGALFAAEVLYRELDLEYEVIVPAVISSVVAYSIFSLVFGWDPLFATPEFVFKQPLQLVPYLVLAVVVAIGAVMYTKIFYGVRDMFLRLRIPRHLKPALGGLVVGCIGFFLPEALGTGYGVVQQALDGHAGVWLLLAVGVVKMVTTAFSLGSGGSGGVFGPAIVIGGALGGGSGLILAELMPWAQVQPGAFALVGMAGFFAAAANTPISTIIMVSEMTGNYHLLVPSMWVCFIAFMLCKHSTIYEKQLATRFEAPVHTGHMMKAVLERIKVARLADSGRLGQLRTVREDADMTSLSELFFNYEHSSFPVLDKAGELVSVVSYRDLWSVVDQRDLKGILLAADLAHAPFTIDKHEDLFQAMRLMAYHKVEELVVIDSKEPRKPLAILSRRDVIRAYQDELFGGDLKREEFGE